MTTATGFARLVVPVFWVLLFVMTGGYSDIFRRFRIHELGQTLADQLHRLHGSHLLRPLAGRHHLRPVCLLPPVRRSFRPGTSGCFFFRFLLTSRTVRRVHDRLDRLQHLPSTGGNERAIAIHSEIEDLPKSPGNRFVGFVIVNVAGTSTLAEMGLAWANGMSHAISIPQYGVEEADHRGGKQRTRPHQHPQRAGRYFRSAWDFKIILTCTTSLRAV
ncbi:MAG: hypothetical protein IPO60_14345 [Flavobacteriales bacterium]|nr:hypothetical protein [Flavobacteriales bacterium]